MTEHRLSFLKGSISDSSLKPDSKAKLFTTFTSNLKSLTTDSKSIWNNPPTKNIFLSFVAGFLTKKRTPHRVKSQKVLPQPILQLKSSPILDNISLEQAKHAQTPKLYNYLKSPNFKSNRVRFPNLKPSLILNEFLVKERLRVEASRSERLIKLQATEDANKLNKESSRRMKLKKISKKKMKKTKKVKVKA